MGTTIFYSHWAMLKIKEKILIRFRLKWTEHKELIRKSETWKTSLENDVVHQGVVWYMQVCHFNV